MAEKQTDFFLETMDSVPTATHSEGLLKHSSSLPSREPSCSKRQKRSSSPMNKNKAESSATVAISSPPDSSISPCPSAPETTAIRSPSLSLSSMKDITASDPPSPSEYDLPETLTYIFAYGSLINDSSRRRTVPSAHHALPCILKGYTRSWSYNCRNTYTAVGISRVEKSVRRRKSLPGLVNGCLVAIEDRSFLGELDERERDYKRVKLDLSEIIFLINLTPSFRTYLETCPTVNIYTYVLPQSYPVAPHKPSHTIPISRKYLDVILSGCLEMSRAYNLDSSKLRWHLADDETLELDIDTQIKDVCFAKFFLVTTVGWGVVGDPLSGNNGKKGLQEWTPQDRLLVDNLLQEFGSIQRYL